MGLRVVIACGGTGGHLFPGIAVAEELQAHGHEVLLLISEKQIDTLATEGYGHLEFRRLTSVAMPKLLSLKMIGFGFRMAKSLLQCRRILKDFQAGTVLGMGGFTSTAPLIAGRLRGCRTYIHESNAIPGRANRLNARFATLVLLGLEACARHFPGRETATVGTPLRPAIREKPSREESLAKFGLSPEKKTLFVMGGSQGAHGINELLRNAYASLPSDRVQVIHITGGDDQAGVESARAAAGIGGVVLPFSGEIQFAYAAADLVVARSGASSLAELSYYGLPSILIPYPFAADDHQTRNAEIFSKGEAAILLQESGTDPRAFSNMAVDLLSDDARLSAMGQAMSAFAVKDAAARVRKLLIEKSRDHHAS